MISVLSEGNTLRQGQSQLLVFYGFTPSDWGRILSWSICGFEAFALIVYLLFDWTVWRLFALQKRGVVTQGRVTEVKRKRSRSGKINYTSINFRALEEVGQVRRGRALRRP